MKLPVKHDTETYQIPINGVECDYCHKKEHQEFVVTSVHLDQAVCEDCWEQFNQ